MAGKRDRKKADQRRRQKAAGPKAALPSERAIRKALDTATADARQLVSDHLRRTNLADGVANLAHQVRDLALRTMRRSPLRRQHECQAGCAFCCHTAVTVSVPEAVAIAEYLREHCTSDELELVRRRLDENAELASSMTREEYIARLIPCGLMTDDGNCRAHPVRPMPCAGFCSTSRAKCEAEFNRVPGRGRVPVDEFTMAAGVAVSNGLLKACRNQEHDGNFYELHHALRRVLDTPDAAERWAYGHDVLAGCMR